MQQTFTLTLATFLVCIHSLFAQNTFELKGKVTNSEQDPLIGATVYLHENKRGTITGLDGTFLLENLNKGKYHIHVSFIGHHGYSQAISVPYEAPLAIVLETSVSELHEVVIEGNPLKEDLKQSVVLFETVSKNFIQKNTGHTLMNSLSQLPGINSINMGMGVSKPVIRGLSFNRVMVTDSGIKQEGQQWGSDHGLEIDQFNIEQIEIIKGPASLAYGSDAIGGVINIRQPTSTQPGSHEGEVQYLYKTVNNTHGVTLGTKGNVNGTVYRFRGTMLDYGDYSVPAEDFRYGSFVLPIFNQELKNTAGEELHFSGMVGINRNWGYSHVTVTNYHQEIGMFSGATGIPRSYQLDDDGDPRNIDLPNQEINHFKIISNSNINVRDDWLELDLGFQENSRKENSLQDAHARQPNLDPDYTTAVELNLRTYSLNARFHTHLLGATDAVFGLQASHQENRKDGFEHLLPNFSYGQAGIFWVSKWKLHKKWNVSGGARVELGRFSAERAEIPWLNNGNEVEISLRNPDVTESLTGYALSIGSAFNPNEHFSYKLNLSKTFRLPSPAELGINGFHHGTFRVEQGDLDLQPEEGYQIDAAILWEADHWLVSFSPYFYYYDNFIFLRPTGQVAQNPPYPGQAYQYSQAEAVHYGGEFSLETRFWQHFKFGLNGDYVYGEKIGLTSGTGNFNKIQPLPFMPQNKVGSSLEYSFAHFFDIVPKAYLKVIHQYRFAQDRVFQNELANPGYHQTSFSLGATLLESSPQVSISLQGQNLFDIRYLDHLSRYRILNLPEPGRNFSLSVTLKW